MSSETTMSETASCSGVSRRFADLRGVQWRIDLGILPSTPSASIDDLRRATANSRRRYATLRRQLLVDPHVPKDGSNSPNLVMDNPLSQSPDSTWSRFFRNAELERMVDQDLTRLYPERASCFQTIGCQGILRRILLLWCLRHPESGYGQGMHELLAPLFYVLQVDVERLYEVKRSYDDHFTDKYDGFSFHENDLTYKFDFRKLSSSKENGNIFENSSRNELDPKIQTIILLSDAYGAEGELGIVLSKKFIEHDCYSMFDALMTGSGGVVAMSAFFSPFRNSQTGLLPVIEASEALYNLLSIVDFPLHSHLVELGVEPQYFALRWFRVLFGREFSLEEILLIWDEIFARENKKSYTESNFGILNSPRGAFISAFAVSIILNLRSPLLATENATKCLQRLLNFPDEVKLVKLLAKAQTLQDRALEANISNLSIYPWMFNRRSHYLDLTSPATPVSTVLDSYWEEKWRVLHVEEEKKNVVDGQVPNRINGWSERVKPGLARTESDPPPSKKTVRTKIRKSSIRQNLLNDLARQLGSDEDNAECDEDNNSDHDNESEKSSVASNSSTIEEYSAELTHTESCETNLKCSALPVSDTGNNVSSKSLGLKEKLLSGKLQWLWKFGRNGSDRITERLGSGSLEDEEASNGGIDQIIVADNGGIDQNIVADVCTDDKCDGSTGTRKGEKVDQTLMVSLRNLGQSMLENIQVVESVFQQDRGHTESSENLSKNGIVGKGQVTAMSALKELRKISNLLSEA